MADTIDFDIVMRWTAGTGQCITTCLTSVCSFIYLDTSHLLATATTLSHYVLSLVLMTCTYLELFGTVLGCGGFVVELGGRICSLYEFE